MLDIKYIRKNREYIEKNNQNRGVKADIAELLELDEKRCGLLKKIEDARRKKNIGAKKKPSPEEIELLKKEKHDTKSIEDELRFVEERYCELLSIVPNLTHKDAPIGGENDFRVIETKGKPPSFSFAPKNHDELFTELGLLDFDRGAKTTGAKFYFTKGDLTLLNLALVKYGIDIVGSHGFTLVETPDIAKNEILKGIGFQPRGVESQIYSIENTDLSLIGTAEITVGGYHANEILDLSGGPKKYMALSHCFRTEAGAYGRESKGLYRVHQFTKLEMFVFCKPDESEKMHSELLVIEKKIANGLKIPYRVIDIASGDLGAPAYRKYDIEAWMTMKNGYGEITSTSNCTDYQSRNLNIRYKTEQGDTAFAHTLNGTAVTTSRWPIAIAENYQQKDGSIAVPKALVKYLGKRVISAHKKL